VVHIADPLTGEPGVQAGELVVGSSAETGLHVFIDFSCPAFDVQVVPAEYAFVVHTADPLTGERGVQAGELVVGMGEALVGNMPGRALSFSAGGGNGAGRNLVWFRDCDPLDCFGR